MNPEMQCKVTTCARTRARRLDRLPLAREHGEHAVSEEFAVNRVASVVADDRAEDRWDEAAGHHSNVVAGKLHNLRRGQSRKEMEASHGEYRHRRAQGE
jgi:hypothetical protein